MAKERGDGRGTSESLDESLDTLAKVVYFKGQIRSLKRNRKKYGVREKRNLTDHIACLRHQNARNLKHFLAAEI